MAKPRPSDLLTLEEAAEVLELTPLELLRSRRRGLPPGTRGIRFPSGLKFVRRDLTPPKKPRRPAASDD